MTSEEEIAALKERLAGAERELERERMRLAGCGVAALQDTPESAADRITPDNLYWSASYGDVCRRVDEVIDLRTRLTEVSAARDAAILALPPAAQVEKWKAAEKENASLHAVVERLAAEECSGVHENPDGEWVSCDELERIANVPPAAVWCLSCWARRAKSGTDGAVAAPAQPVAPQATPGAGGWTVREGVLYLDWHAVASALIDELSRREKGTAIVDFVTAIVRKHSPAPNALRKVLEEVRSWTAEDLISEPEERFANQNRLKMIDAALAYARPSVPREDECPACGHGGMSMDRIGGACPLVPGPDGTGGCPDPLAWLRARRAATAGPSAGSPAREEAANGAGRVHEGGGEEDGEGGGGNLQGAAKEQAARIPRTPERRVSVPDGGGEGGPGEVAPGATEQPAAAPAADRAEDLDALDPCWCGDQALGARTATHTDTKWVMHRREMCGARGRPPNATDAEWAHVEDRRAKVSLSLASDTKRGAR